MSLSPLKFNLRKAVWAFSRLDVRRQLPPRAPLLFSNLLRTEGINTRYREHITAVVQYFKSKAPAPTISPTLLSRVASDAALVHGTFATMTFEIL